jgi:hypothetical protein
MAKESFIDLGQKPEAVGNIPAKPSDKAYYPSMHVSGVDLKDGDEVLIKGVVTSCTSSSRNGKKTYSCEVEGKSMKVVPKGGGEDKLDAALTKIEKSKVMPDDEEAETQIDDEETEGES